MFDSPEVAVGGKFMPQNFVLDPEKQHRFYKAMRSWVVHEVVPSDTLESLSEIMLNNTLGNPFIRTKEEAIQIIAHNNELTKGQGVVFAGKHSNILKPGDIVNLTPAAFNAHTMNYWRKERAGIRRELFYMDNDTKDFLVHNPPDTIQTMLNFIEMAEGAGYAVGKENVKKVLKDNTSNAPKKDPRQTALDYGGYISSIASGYAANNSSAFSNVNKVAVQLLKDAQKQLKNNLTSKKLNDLRQLEKILRGSPKYQELIQSIEKLPAYFKPRLGAINPNVSQAVYKNARWFRKQFIIPSVNGSAKYLNTVNRRVGSQILRYTKMGTRATWIIPAIFAIGSIALSDNKVKTAMGEGIGIPLGAWGTTLGLTGGQALAGSLVTAGLITTPLGVFVVVSLVAGGLGIAFYEFGKYVGTQSYDTGNDIYEWIIK